MNNNYLTPKHMMPLLIVCETNHDLPSGTLRFHTIDKLAEIAKQLADLGMPRCKLYVKTRDDLKNGKATAGLDENGLMLRAIKKIKDAVPEMQIGTEVCACAYQSTGECVLVNKEGVDDAATHELVSKMAVLHAKAGADVIVAGLTHDGSVRAIRNGLDYANFSNVKIMGSVQLRTGFYAPYRTMMGTEPEAGETFRAHIDPANTEEVLRRAALLIDEGADSLSIQPALIGINLVSKIKKRLNVPLAVYSVSTELNLVRGDLPDLWLAPGRESIFEEYFCRLIEAGADQIQTYVAQDMAEWLTHS